MLAGLLRAEVGTRAAAPFPTPLSPLQASFLRCAPDISIDEAERLPAQSERQRRFAPTAFAFGSECRSRSLRNRRSPSPESALKAPDSQPASLQSDLKPSNSASRVTADASGEKYQPIKWFPFTRRRGLVFTPPLTLPRSCNLKARCQLRPEPDGLGRWCIENVLISYKHSQ